MALTEDEMEENAKESAPYFPSDTPVYLSGANPFALPSEKLKEYARRIDLYFPYFSRISMQSRINDIAAKSDEELKSLVNAGIRHLYIGVENGNDDALELMNKGHSAKDTVTQLKRLDAAGMEYTNFYVLGLGGKGQGKKSARLTAEMFNQVHPRRITTTFLTLFDKAPIAAMSKSGAFVAASEREMIEELGEFLARLEIDVFYDGIHYLNTVNYRFSNLDKTQKTLVLKDIKETLESCSDDELELMANRKSKLSL